jgi:MFS family permease
VLRLVPILLATETTLYSAITPLLPQYSRALNLSQGAVGVLVATYSGGLIVGSVVGAHLVGRVGPRRTILLGLGVLATSSIGFGFAGDAGALDSLRAAQGFGAALLWAGGLVWLIGMAGPERRGALIGTAFGAAILGTLIGPVIGTIASAVSTILVFALIGFVNLVLAIFVWRSTAPERADPERGASLRSALRQVSVLVGVWLVVLPALSISLVNALVPLRMAEFGASGVAVGITFLIAAAIATATSPTLGRLTDRLGPAILARLALVTLAPCLAVLVLPNAAWGVAILTILLVGGALTASLIPAVTLLTQATEGAGLSLGFGAMLFNVSFALGETFGAIGGAKLAQGTSDELPFTLIAVTTLLTACLLARRIGRVPSAFS